MKAPKSIIASGRPAGVRTVVLVVLALIALAVAAHWVTRTCWQHAEPPPLADPRLTYDTLFRNVRPDVKYVGDAACADCHADHATSYRRHSMGHAFAPVSSASPLERYDRSANNPFESLGYQFVVERRDGKLFHKESHPGPPGQTPIEIKDEVKFALGSGARGRSFLIEREGRYLFQSPISWYSQKGAWDLAPSFGSENHFDRPVSVRCLICHCNRANDVEHTVNRFRQPIFDGYAIGCERCHGPGELHVRRPGEKVDGIDYTIVNPKHLEPSLREPICQQCHLQGEFRVLRQGRGLWDFRPGLPIHLFWSVFVKPPEQADQYKAVSHVEQMYASRCFQKSKGKRDAKDRPLDLGCMSCHNPHELRAPEKNESYYRDRCLQCHTDRSCSAEPARRRGKQDDCVACHMPRLPSSNVSHTVITDHRIVRRPSAGNEAASDRRPQAVDPPLVHFHQDQPDPDQQSVNRDFALALVKMARQPRPPEQRRNYGRRARSLLEAALNQRPDDLDARQALGYALWLDVKTDEALAAFRAVLEKAPEHEETLVDAATLTESLKRPDPAIDYWRRAIAVNPWMADYRGHLALLLAEKKDWPAARDECLATLRFHPRSGDLRKLLIRSYLQTGQQQQARQEFDTLLSLNPNSQGELRQWFAAQTPE